MTIEGWHIIDEPGAPPLATKRDDAWAFINEAGGGVDLEVRHCGETQRAVIPVKVLDALLAAWRARKAVSPP